MESSNSDTNNSNEMTGQGTGNSVGANHLMRPSSSDQLGSQVQHQIKRFGYNTFVFIVIFLVFK